ncbi:MAG: D-alanyl-D-alanine carboxypeptidase [Lachnospira sp.]|nr:D-alanyl-D-alanine carboxypeptidase [Lachnospira sp.]
MSNIKKRIFHKKNIKYVAVLLTLTLFVIALTAGAQYYLPDYTITTNNDSDEIEYIATSGSTSIATSLYSKYACLMDADTGRILIGKNANTQVPMASTTKIMTLIIALEYGERDFVCTTSPYAATMPDVQLNAKSKETFVLDDLLYSLMLQSHNDSAVIIAENVALQYITNVRNQKDADILGITTDATYDFVPDTTNPDSSFIGSLSKEQSKLLVKVFTGLMNKKAAELGCYNTHFITPNGLDAQEDEKIHSTTPRDLSIIMSYCIKNEEFLKITQTPSHSFSRYSVSNANAFLNMYPNIISGKTGFTNDAGYCYVCAYTDGERTFIVSLLACGWPNNKTYKWKDAKKMLNYARESYFPTQVVEADTLSHSINIINGLADSITITNPLEYSMLLSKDDVVNVTVNAPNYLKAPVYNGQNIGSIDIYVNEELHNSIPLYSGENVDAKDSNYYIKSLLNQFLFIDK